MTEREIFEAALEMADPGERDRYLDRACGGNTDLRKELDDLITAQQKVGSFLDRPIGRGPATVDYAPLSEKPGTKIGPYVLREQIGEGGFGLVFVAEQTEPVKRKVALKVIKPGMDTREVMARFTAERQALALMDHPNIARVLDAGATDSGRPYFVMELVRGIPITEYCDQNHLSPRERLDLFITVCQAIQHAHQKGIIHRDIKPSNVLVTSHDGKPVAKVIDFGVAKAINQQLTDRSIYTNFAQMIGTPLYMSPEQAEMSGLDIDTRSDIYSLGVLLYELLTGTTPLEKKRFKEAAYDEIRRLIREEEPPKPSTRLSTSDSIASVAAQRKTEPAKLSKLMRGDLDWITMKCLEKDRTRRYETANGLARDIQRYLDDEPVEACPPSATYRLRKFANKYRGALMTAATIALLLIAGIGVSTWQAIRATRAEREALVAQQAEAERAEGERLAKEQAERNLAFAKKGNDLLGSVFAGLDPKANYETVADLRNALRDNLTKAVTDLEGSAIGDPLEVAAMQSRLGLSLWGLGEAKLAIAVFTKARETNTARLGPDHPSTIASTHNLAEAYRIAGQIDLALPLYQETLERRQVSLGPDHPDTLNSMHYLANGYGMAGQLDRALPLLTKTVERMKAQLGPVHPDTVASMNNLAECYRTAGQLDLALRIYQEVVDLEKARLGLDHPSTLTGMNNLALGYHSLGRLDQALPLLQETLERRKTRLGPDHPDTLTSMHNLALGYEYAGQLDLALPLYQETLARQKAKLGLDHPETLNSMSSVAVCYEAAGKLDLALPLFIETLERERAKLGPDHPNTLVSMGHLASCYRAAGQLDRALPLFKETLERTRAKLGPDHPNTLVGMNNLALCYQAARQLDLALPLFKETLERSRAKLGPDHPGTLISMNSLAVAYKEANQLDQALPLLEEAARGHERRRFRDGSARTLVPTTIRVYEAAGKFEQADEWRRKWIGFLKEQAGAELPAYAGELSSWSLSLLKRQKWAEAEPLLRECMVIREKTQPEVWTTFNTLSMLGGALLGEKKFADAEPLLIKGYEGMKQREDKIPKTGGGELRIPEALDRLIELYTATDKPDDVEKWQAERAKYPAANAAEKK